MVSYIEQWNVENGHKIPLGGKNKGKLIHYTLLSEPSNTN